MALTDLTRISTSGIATGTSLSGAILHGDAHFRGTQVGVTSALFDSSDNALEFNEDAKLKFGNTLSIYKATGSHAIIDNTFATGSYLRIGSANGIILGSPLSHNQTMMRGYVNGRSELYHAGNLKLTTDQAGVKVTGILTATSFSGPLNSSPINNPSGISTFYDLRVSNNLTVEGTTTTLDTNLIGVDRVEVGANSNSVVGVAITQSGTADILRLYDGASQVVTVADGGSVGIGSATPLNTMALDVVGSIRYSVAMRGATGSASTPSYAFYADHDSGMYRGGTNILSFATAGNQRLRITNDGTLQYTSSGGKGYEFGASGSSKSTAANMFAPASYTLAFATNNEERLRIDADGRHLIGDSTSRFYAAKLQVQGASDSNYIMMHNTTAGDGNGARYSKFIYSGTQSGGETSDLAHINAAHDGSADDQKGRLEFRVNTGAQNHSPVEALRINSSGRVSIGSNIDAASILEVREENDGGQTKIMLYNTDNDNTTTQTAGLFMSPDSRAYAYAGLSVKKENADMSTNAGRDVSLVLNTTQNNSQVEAVHITSAGQFLMGTTSSSGARAIIQQDSSDTNPLDQNTSADSSGLRIQNYSFGVSRYTALSLEACSATQVQSASIIAQSVANGQAPDIIIAQRTSVGGNTERLRIRSGGEVAIGGSGYAGQPFSVQTSSTNLGYMQSTGTTRAVMNFVDANSTQNVGFGCVGNNHVFTKDGNEKVRITVGGDVGIGTDSPSYRLQVHHGNPGGLLRLLSGHEGNYDLRFVYQNSEANIWSYGSKDLTFGTRYNKKLHLVTNGPSKRLTINGDLIGINETDPSNQLHVAGTTGTNAGGLLRLDAATGDNFILFDNTSDSTEWAVGNDSGSRDEFRLYYNGGSGYGTEIINIDGTSNNGVVTIDGGYSTLVKIKGDSTGSAGLRLGGDSTQNQCTGYVEVHQDESHGGGIFYNGDGSPSFATGEAADYISIHRLSAGTRHSVMRWFHSSNDCEVQGNMLVDNGTSSTVYVRADNGGQAGVMCGGDNASGQTQSTGFFEAHQDDNYGGGFSYNGDGTPAFVTGETADHIVFFRRDSGTRTRVFSYPYNSSNVNFASSIEHQGQVMNYNSANTNRGYFYTQTSSQNATVCPTMAGTLHYGFGYQEAYSTSGGTWTNPYPDLVLGYHTGVSIGGHPNYNGTRFFGDHPSATTSVVLNVGNGGNGVNVPHALSKGGGTFRIRHPHPSKKYTHDLQHSFIEGPQCDNIYRGRVDLVGGAATVNIDTASNMTDGTFVLLNRDIQCFTSNETGWTAVKGSVTENILTITAQDNSCTDTISWMVIGERQDDKIKSPDMDITDADGKLIVEPLTIESSHM